MTAFDTPSLWSNTLLAKCRNGACVNSDVWWREHESSDGAFEDTEFHCRTCGTRWWIEGGDA